MEVVVVVRPYMKICSHAMLYATKEHLKGPTKLNLFTCNDNIFLYWGHRRFLKKI